MKKWFKKIGQSFLRKDEIKDKDASPTVHQEIKDKDTTPTVDQEIKAKDTTPTVDQEIKAKDDTNTIDQEIKAKDATPTVDQEIKAKDATPTVDQEEVTKIQKYKSSWLNKLGDNFKKTSSNIRKAIFAKRIDEKSLEEIEDKFPAMKLYAFSIRFGNERRASRLKKANRRCRSKPSSRLKFQLHKGRQTEALHSRFMSRTPGNM